MRAYREKHRKEILSFFGNHCANPYNLKHGDFLSDERVLEIDHVKGNGNFERRKFGNSNDKYLRFVLQKIKDGSKDYQLLCANCNRIKRKVEREN